MYKGLVGVPPLAMIDDVICTAVCGLKSVEVTAFINAKSNAKKIQFGVDKCHQLHIGKKKGICPELHIDSLGIKKMDEAKTGFKNLVDVKMDDHKLENVEKEKYLGDIHEKCDENLIQSILETPRTTAKCMLYLETGAKPICFILMKKRLMFLHYTELTISVAD